MTAKQNKQDATVQDGRGSHDWSSTSKERSEAIEGFVHRILGPDGKEWRWLARSIYGHVADGRTPDAAVANLRAGMEALAEALGLSYEEWRRLQKPDGSRFVRTSDLVPS